MNAPQSLHKMLSSARSSDLLDGVAQREFVESAPFLHPYAVSPIFVTGMPRSGTTFVQHLLSQHPRIAIHGQEPAGVSWASWLQALIEGLQAAPRSNAELEYAVPHYAGRLDTQTARREFLEFLRHYFIADEPKPRWGLKSLLDCRTAASDLLSVWPETKWIVCLRNPFLSIESVRNTYDRGQLRTIDELVAWWVDAAQFAAIRSEALPVYIDRLTDHDIRRSWLRELFAFLGEEVTPDVAAFVDCWPVIHQVVRPEQRTYRLSPAERAELLDRFPMLADWRKRLGFVDDSCEVSGG
jgi:hypothetical protein